MKWKGRKLGECTCDYCGQLFQKPLSEIKRNSSLGRRNFCSRTCVGKNLNTLEFERFDLTKLGYKRYGDEYTKFRYHFRNIKQRHHDVDITIDDLKEQWEKQNGICEFSGINLILSSYKKIDKSPFAIFSGSNSFFFNNAKIRNKIQLKMTIFISSVYDR